MTTEKRDNKKPVARPPRDATKEDTREVFFFRYRPAFFGGFVPPGPGPDGKPPAEPQLRPPIEIWTKHPASVNYSKNDHSFFTVDLTKTPLSGCLSGEVEVDDHVNISDGFTTMGPSHPHAYGAGGVYLRLPPPGPSPSSPVIPKSGSGPIPTDQTAIVRGRTGAEIQRYHGFTGLHLGSTDHPDLNLWVVYHPGSASETHHRPPRKLVVPKVSELQNPFDVLRNAGIDDNVINQLSVSVSESSDAPPSGNAAGQPDELAIYLERNYALYTAEMDVPKKPSGCSEAEDTVPRPPPAVPLALNVRSADAGSRQFPPTDGGTGHGRGSGGGRPSVLNVVGAFTDCSAPVTGTNAVATTGEIDIIATNIKLGDHHNLVQLSDEETLFDALSRFANDTHDKFDCLDLIGHSRGRDNILKLGELAITSRVASKEFSALANSGILDKLGIKSIRLLGCRTACSPRGQRVVATILKFFTGSDQYSYPVEPPATGEAPVYLYPAYATRGDMFAVHFDNYGLRREAESLLADSDVITNAGPGDLPPGDDYPPDPPSDDDDGDEVAPSHPPVPSPYGFSVSSLSDCNAATVAAGAFQFWDEFGRRFDALKQLLCHDVPIQDNPLFKATCEVLVAISADPRSVDDLRSFDLMLDKRPYRIRVHTSTGAAYAFRFENQDREVIAAALHSFGLRWAANGPEDGINGAKRLSKRLSSWI